MSNIRRPRIRDRVLSIRGESMTEAQKRAQKKYDEAHRKDFRIVNLKLNREADADIIAKLEASGNIQGYIKDLIRADI